MRVIIGLVICGVAAAVIAGMALAIWKKRDSAVSAAVVDERMRNAYAVYTTGTFPEVTNCLRSYLEFLERAPDELRRSRDIDAMMYIAHQKLAYMAVAAVHTDEACLHLSEAYRLHQRQSVRAHFEIIPRTNFIESVLKGVEAVDAQTGAKWKSEFSLDTNIVTKVRALFLQSGRAASSE